MSPLTGDSGESEPTGVDLAEIDDELRSVEAALAALDAGDIDEAEAIAARLEPPDGEDPPTTDEP